MIARAEGITYLFFFFSLTKIKKVVGDREKCTPKSGKISPKMCHFEQNIDFIAKLSSVLKNKKKWRLGKDESNRFQPFNWKRCDIRIETKLNGIPGWFFCRNLGQF